ncbi:GDP-mannose 4,6-dehydratase [Arcobacter sp. FWKO B]|uniref:GDP-mannose 4,6-dehydratase n=1 Tax=Arcobacter sp. FWKO B TaxID=2593672 RepID=UPI0018A68D71|nr:GDP-mannose 4,6-dehydratase [Arcobacter sp. FWKO B]QOG12174.1 NAD-dependent epimerase/dehydratase family protein [Arcobacter sp. FWKO B]
MKYLILGSNSFSGGSFIKYCLDHEKDASIFAVSRCDEYHSSLLAYKNHKLSSSVKFFKLDLNNDIDKIVEIIARERIDYIINFAAQGMVAQSWDEPLHWINTNVTAIVNLVHKIYKFDFIKKFVQISTPEVYGSCVNQQESMCFAPSSPYAASKASADLFLYSFYNTMQFPVNFTRAANVYGAYQQLYRIIPKTILSIKKNTKLHLQGGGKAVRSFIHIDDVSSATLKIAKDAKSGEIFHISDTKSISIYDLVNLICKEMDVRMSDFVEIVDDRKSQDSVYLMDNTKLINELGYTPKCKLKEGIREVIKWIDDNYDYLKDTPDYYIHKA